MRVLGDITLFADGDETAGDTAWIIGGIAVVDSDAAAAGALPDPEADGPGWLYRFSRVIVSPGGVNLQQAVTHVGFDVQSPRKMGGHDTLQMIISNIAIVAALDVVVRMTSRTMYKLA